jgi:uncharacterized protein (DUF488 family)
VELYTNANEGESQMEVYTIGFTHKTAAQFFELLHRTGIRQLIDVRLNNVSQLAGFTKREDLKYFLRAICDAAYIHELLLAPTQELFDGYKKRKWVWEDYETRYLALMSERRVEMQIDRHLFDTSTVVLCSEASADHCHRRLAVEYLQSKWGGLAISHL